MNRENTRCLIVRQLTRQPSPVFTHKYFSCPRMSRVNRIFITFAFVFHAFGRFMGVCSVTLSHTTVKCRLSSSSKKKTQSDKRSLSMQTMTNFICQYSKPIFFQFNILLLDRATLTTYFHSSE